MKLAILSREPKNYSTKRLVEVAKKRGHTVKVLNTLKFALDLETDSPDLYYQQKPLSHYDAVLPRIGASMTYFGTAVVRQFQQMDTYTPNTADGILNSRDKLRSFQILSRHNIGIPPTTFVKTKLDVLPAIETAIRASKLMGLGISGVDMLEGKDGPQIMEINSSPGLEGIEGCTKLDIAGAFIDHMAGRVDFPEIDLKQRFAVSKGYGVTEIIIPKESEYVGKTIFESGLREKDINALSLHRGAKVIPNPKGERVLEADDRILCFGKIESMKDLIPEKIKKRRKAKIKRM